LITFRGYKLPAKEFCWQLVSSQQA